ncbi:glutamate racemase [Paralimibaculum aggregatum]|uniref:Glutamate racemase n=1 Tax=Paralimibaculum aggregatum TaxID=3036245 RepID=A0ABQ6LRX7_9RHOB|nr:aspartate/glutamate racemase family protein [Limibaculum sp. NKW23]GMG84743.1 glutamate racemase [Limibaculum sp. NKW23]
MAIGVFDSGLGGLTVLRTIRARLPWYDYVFYGDNLRAPYGPREPEEIYALTRDAVARLFAEGCGLVILACNTASAIALRRLQDEWLPQHAPERRVLGVFVPVIEAVTGRPWGYTGPPLPALLGRVALFATRATVASGAFRRELAFRATGLEVEQEACPGLVDALERADLKGAEAIARAHAAALLQRMPNPQAALLGCTHYPIVEHAFRAMLPAGTEILSQPRIVAESLADYLRRHPRFGPGSGEIRMLTSGDPGAVATGALLPLGQPAEFRTA